MSEKELEDAFSEYGDIMSVVIMKGIHSKRLIHPYVFQIKRVSLAGMVSLSLTMREI